MEIAALCMSILVKVAPLIFDYVKGEIDGGADAKELRSKPVDFSIAFGGKIGRAYAIQLDVESDMSDPSAT
jgi:hypothetical protein